MELKQYIEILPPGRARTSFRKQLAEKLSVSTEAIRGWENKTRKPRFERVLQIEKITNNKVTRFDLRPDLCGDKEMKT